MILTRKEIKFILNKISDGKFGYNEDPFIGKLQAKLSMMLQLLEISKTDED